MNLYKMFETNPRLEREGVRVDIAEGIWFKVARSGGSNKEFAKVSNEILKPYNGVLDELSDEKADELNARIYARSVVRDWGGVTDREGNELEFNEDNVVRIFTDLPDLFRTIRLLSSSAESYKKELQEQSAGN